MTRPRSASGPFFFSFPRPGPSRRLTGTAPRCTGTVPKLTKPVKISRQDEKQAIIADGVKSGDMLVVSGFGRLKDAGDGIEEFRCDHDALCTCAQKNNRTR